MKKLLLLAALSIAVFKSAWADIVVIVNSSNDVVMAKSDVRRIYMGKSGQFPNGKPTKAMNYESNNALRHQFDKGLLNRDPAQIQALWAKLVFTGQGIPPTIAANPQDMINFVKSEPNAIGYINESDVSPEVRVVIKF
ncbi:phosphate ABC transporter substrate-binding protein [Alteromonas sp. a30]|uniref:phosphate ABC transporter substrate-binding protein n=1 Tax=Alteromonas sp. a30 TaxID=2730917 RepID=UPI0022815856|nr:phosphate ABC transporter substrate-binding protein [Alteromonas sp. a30]MCY7297370.1 phosphate ABC transporter substrate-binding protein [Alteromonas sp. a30]